MMVRIESLGTSTAGDSVYTLALCDNTGRPVASAGDFTMLDAANVYVTKASLIDALSDLIEECK